jgi:hypothetical protein
MFPEDCNLSSASCLTLKTLHLCVFFTGDTFDLSTDSDTNLGLSFGSLKEGIAEFRT